jgi:hypothetical protein
MQVARAHIPTIPGLFRGLCVVGALLGVLSLLGCGPSDAEKAKQDAIGKQMTQAGAERIMQDGGHSAPTQPPPNKTYDYGK